jgi:hypothetical protein
MTLFMVGLGVGIMVGGIIVTLIEPKDKVN